MQVLLDNGTLITYTIARHSGDVERIFVDKSLISRLGIKVDNGMRSLSVGKPLG